jgi:hypothetical protein
MQGSAGPAARGRTAVAAGAARRAAVWDTGRMEALLRPRDPLVNRDQDLRRWQRTHPDATPVADLAPRHPGTAVGVVKRIRVEPGKTVEVTLEDGSGDLVALWAGRTRLTGVELGSALRLCGTVGEDGDGRKRMRNPAWQTVTEPYA